MSSVMKFHVPLRMICFVQAETEGDTLFFVCSFRNFRKYTFDSCSRFIAEIVLQVTSELYTEIHFQGLALLDQAEDWSTLWIGVSYGTISTLSILAQED